VNDVQHGTTPPRLSVRGARKRFGGVVALDGVDVSVRPGELHAIVGENGAGKSTLMKLLSGAELPDAGEMRLDGAPYAPRTPGEARARGVAMIYQELSLCPHLSVLDNVTLGRERSRFGVQRRAEEEPRLVEVLRSLGVDGFGPRTRVGALGPGDRQLVEIARALHADARVVVFDEPTSSLGPEDAARLRDVARGLAERGVSVLWISHFLEEVLELCDGYTVLRDGVAVESGSLAGMSEDDLASRMVGRDLDEVYPEVAREPGAVALRVRGLTRADGAVRGADLDVRRGEIVGVFGLVGAGRTELMRALIGLDRARFDALEVDGRAVERPDPRAMAARGVALASEDRAQEGLALDLSIADNVALPSLGRLAGRLGALSPAAKTREASAWGERLGIKWGRPTDPVRTLSGGNQQKVALARLMSQGAEVLLLDEPTRGVDVGAKVEVYALLGRLAAEGKAVLVSSSYLPELFGIADRIAVMTRGALGPARPTTEWTEDAIMRAAASAGGEASVA